MGKIEGIVEEIVKGLVNEMAKEGSADDAEKDTGIPKGKQEIGKVTFSKDGDTKFTVTNVNPETGQISWKVTDLPAFDKLLDDADELSFTARQGILSFKTLIKKLRSELSSPYCRWRACVLQLWGVTVHPKSGKNLF